MPAPRRRRRPRLAALVELDRDQPTSMLRRGLAEVQRMGRRRAQFSMNDLAPAFDAVDIDRHARGLVLQRAVSSGLIRQVGTERSLEPAARGRQIALYTAVDRPAPSRRATTAARLTDTVTVPVSRSHGRFAPASTNVHPQQLGLFDPSPEE